MKHKQTRTLVDTLRLWTTVFLTNWVGTMAVAWVLAQPGIIAPEARPIFAAIGQHSIAHSFGEQLLKAVFAGWLIALLVWLLPFAETGRFAVIMLMTYVIALGSFTHVVAGSVDTFYLVARGDLTWGDYLGRFMLPTLLGNVIGGVALVAVLNHAQVTAGSSKGA